VAYAAKKNGVLQIALINKGTENATVALDQSLVHKHSKKQKGWILTGPSLESTQNVTLEAIDQRRHASNRISVPAHSAVLWSF
jgi:hypothetical protein